MDSSWLAGDKEPREDLWKEAEKMSPVWMCWSRPRVKKTRELGNHCNYVEWKWKRQTRCPRSHAERGPKTKPGEGKDFQKAWQEWLRIRKIRCWQWTELWREGGKYDAYCGSGCEILEVTSTSAGVFSSGGRSKCQVAKVGRRKG